MSGQWDAEMARQRKAKRKAKELGDELLTPGALAELFDLSPTTVRTARHKGRIEAYLTLALSRDVPLFHLREAIAVWGEPKDAELLERMRQDGPTLQYSSTVFNVLNPRPLVTLRVDADELQGRGP